MLLTIIQFLIRSIIKWRNSYYKWNSKGIDNKNRIITSDKLTYNKITNIVDAEGKVKVEDVVNNYTIFSDTAKYNRNEEIVTTSGNSKGIDNKNRIITSDKLTYNKDNKYCRRWRESKSWGCC